MPRVGATRVRDGGHWDALRAIAWRSSPGYAVFVGDSLSTLSSLPSGFVDTCLTSPPYWGARDYGNPKQLGLEAGLEEYISKLVELFREVRRLLKPRGTAWLNLGDSYFHGAGTIGGRPPARGWKRNKQLVLVPFRLAIALQEDGWWLRNVVVWHKPNAMPSSVADRLTNTWEPVFLLAKSEHYDFNLDAIRMPHKTDDAVERRRAEGGLSNGKARGQSHLRRWLNSPRHRATIEGKREVRRRPNAPNPTELARHLRSALSRKQQSIEWVAQELGLPFERTRHYFRTDEIGSRLPPESVWHRLKSLLELGDQFDEAMAVEVGDNVFRNHPHGRNPGDVLDIAVSSSDDQHFAQMPLRLATRCLQATLPREGVCLDPFMGAGTSGVATLDLGGRFVGVELRREFASHFVEVVTDRNPRRLHQMPLLGGGGPAVSGR
jgi:DNA modification methylase